MKNRRPTRKHKHAPFQHIRPMSPDRVEKLLYGETLPNQHNQQRLEEKRKGTLIMPSLQDALQTAIQKQTSSVLHQTIQDWAQDDQPKTETKPEEKTVANPNPKLGKLFAETTGVSRAVFNYVKDNPNCLRKQAVDDLIANGFNATSVASLVTQNIRAGIFTLDGHGRLHCNRQAYVSVPSGNKRKALAPMSARKTAKTKAPKAKTPKAKVITLINAPKPTEQGIAALKVDAAPITAPTSNFDPQAFLNTLSIIQARALYDELKKVFGVF